MKKKSVEYSLKAEKKEFPIEKICSSKDSFEYAKKFYFDDINIYESVFIILLNSVCNTTGYAKITQGGIDTAVVDKRIIAKYAIESLATRVILVHNHTSGSLKPSREDDCLTREVEDCLSLFGIKLLDHLVITEDNYYSYNDEGRL